MVKSQIPGQVAILEVHPDTFAERILPAGREPQQEPAYETVIGGPSVSLQDYYEGQLAVLGYFNKLNKGENFRARFQAAAGGSGEDRAVMEAQLLPRYGGSRERLNKAYDESLKGKDRLDALAKRRFAQGLGYDTATSARLRPKIVLDSMLQSDYDEFSGQYYGVANADAKDSYARRLNGRLRGLKKRIADPEKFKTPQQQPVDTEEPTIWSVYLDENRGVLSRTPETTASQQEMTFAEFIAERSSVFGGGTLEEGADVEFHVRPRDFANITPDSLRRGLYINRFDPRYGRIRKDNNNPTRQLAWAWGRPPISSTKPKILNKLKLEDTGVVLPADEFGVLAHSPGAINAFVQARTRDSNAGNPDIKEVDEKEGRSGGHAMESKIEKIDELIPRIEEEIAMFKTIYDAADPESTDRLPAGQLAALTLAAEERLHVLVDTARLNLGHEPSQTKAMHRALASKLFRPDSAEELSTNWRIYASLGAQYAYARLAKAIQSRERCHEQLAYFQPFLDRAEDQKAA
ncbi:MAG TPA: hypothetical protein VFX86_04850 [Candidatus Saccharimonadales bacterium]|nr:hypothetical protein [Candidatus Saccharimonadales bacterium]